MDTNRNTYHQKDISELLGSVADFIKTKSGKKLLLLFMLLLSMSIPGRTQNIQSKIVFLKGSAGSIVPNAVLPLQDDYWNSSNRSNTDSLYPIKNIISLKVNDSLSGILSTDSISVTVRIRVVKIYFSGANESTDTSLTISYGTSIAQYKEVSNWVFGGATEVDITILGITASDTSFTKNLILENEMQEQPQFKFTCTTDTVTSVNKDTSTVSSLGELTVYWPIVNNASQYDLEWTYIDSSALWRYTSSTGIFKHNATRVSITGLSYKIPLLYDNTGVLFYRVRATEINNDGTVVNSNWTQVNLSNIGGNDSYWYQGHERPLNWQATTSYAEEGKRKSVVQYYDGSLRGRQTVTKDNTTNTTIVSETYYDFQGRPAIQVMPAPTLNTIIQYTKNFNSGLYLNQVGTYEYSKTNYDTIINNNYCGAAANPMSTSSGASWYYSSANSEKNNGFNMYIPDASMYAFTQTEYTQDNTGRISSQSGVGTNYTLGSGHETKYFYGSPSQESLNALFGTDVGAANHYFKNMVMDANGQYSVSYVDMHGRTVATALAGNPTPGMDTISSYAVQSETDKLIDSTSQTIKGLVIEQQNSILTSTGSMHEFKYDLSTDTLFKLNCTNANVPYNCLYDLSISIISNCNNANMPGGKALSIFRSNYTVSNGTVTPMPGGLHVDTSFTLPAGNYDVTKQLSVSNIGMQYLRDSVFMKNNTCKSFKYFEDSISNAQQAADTSCAPSCYTCLQNLGTWTTFKANYYSGNKLSSSADSSAAWAAYQSALTDCNDLCNVSSAVNDLRQEMLDDVSPPSGQYANYDSIDKFSIFYHFGTIQVAGVTDTLRLYQNPAIQYVDAYGKPALVYDPISQKMVPPNQLDSAQFAANFQPSWADSLLRYHPEYCKLVQYQSHNASFIWDGQFEQINSYADAVSGNYFNPLADTTVSNVNRDPLAVQNSGAYYSRLYDSLNNYHGLGFSLWTFACTSIKCVGYTNLNDTSCVHGLRVSPFQNLACAGDQDMAWRLFRTIYLQIKSNIYYDEAPNCTVTPAQLLTANHTLRFNNFSNAASQNSLSTNTSTMSSAGNNQFSQTLDSNCMAWKNTWIQQLSACPNYSSTTINQIVSLLYQICREGADANHLYGSRDIPSDSPSVCINSGANCFRSFDDVLSYFNSTISVPSTNLIYCNADIITSPALYNSQIIYSNESVWNSPDSCECSNINKLYNQYVAITPALDASFSAYMLRTQGTVMADSDLTTLRNLCNGGTLCRYLQTPISLPPVFQCYSGNICVSCMVIDSLYTRFTTAYPGIIPTYSETDTSGANAGLFDSVQYQINTLFANFMNNHLGFSMLTPDYLNFMSQCKTYFTGSTTIAPATALCSAPLQTSFDIDSNHLWPLWGTDSITHIYPYYDLYYNWSASNRAARNNTPAQNLLINGSLWSFKHATSEYRTHAAFNSHYRLRLDANEFYDAYITLPPLYNASYIRFYARKASPDDPEGHPDTIHLMPYIDYTLDGTSWIRVDSFDVSDPYTYHLCQTNKVIPNGARIRILYLMHPEQQQTALLIDSLSSDGYTAICTNNFDSTCNVALGFTQSPNKAFITIPYSSQSSLKDSSFMVQALFKPVNTGVENCILSNRSNTTNGFKLSVLANGNISLQLAGHEFHTTSTSGINVYDNKSHWISVARKIHYGNPDSLLLNLDGVLLSIYGSTGSTTYNYNITNTNANLHVGFDSVGNIGYSGWVDEVRIWNNYIRGRLYVDMYNSAISTMSTTEIAYLVGYYKMNSGDTCNQIVRDYSSIQNNGYLGSSSATKDINDPVWLSSSQIAYTAADPTGVANNCTCLSTPPLLCGKSTPLIPRASLDSTTACSDSANIAATEGTDLYRIYLDSLMGKFEADYLQKCMTAYLKESFVHTFSNGEYHYTLYYYDQAGNLIQTVPPKGVVPIARTTWSDSVNAARMSGTGLVNSQHTLMTKYRYNSLNQVVQQNTPDANSSAFWYDRLGRLAISQNAKQATNNQYSYTLYDSIGRITEVGQLSNTVAMDDSISRRDDRLIYWIGNCTNREQITRTVYDVQYTPINTSLNAQNLRNRVSYTAYYNNISDTSAGGQASATFYSYDIHGNVDTLLQDYNGISKMAAHGNRFKKITYQYDLISGKVNSVAYQPNQADAFYHSYLYDAENRLTNVLTSHDSINWDNDAYYSYYKHGPLANTITGQLQVQSSTNVYTLQGWIKAVNPTVAMFGGAKGNGIDTGNTNCGSGYAVDTLLVNARIAPNPNQYIARKRIELRDGFRTADNDNVLVYINDTLSTCHSDPTGNGPIIGGSQNASNGSLVARDAYSYALNYYSDSLGGSDYTGIAATPSCQLIPTQLGSSFRSLYNGNISSMGVNIPKLGDAMVYNYKYDQLNRLTVMDAYTASSNFTGLSATDNYKERVGYDANGNILRYFRNGTTTNGSPLAMDSLTYKYKMGTNQLDHVHDAVPATNYSVDIDNQDTLNYTYDNIGNLTSDVKEGIDNIYWTVYGKIDSIHKTSGVTIKYRYDASGNRIYKVVHTATNNNYTSYVRDASGNVMSVYIATDTANSGHLMQSEVDLYGSNRLGVWYANIDVDVTNSPNDPNGYWAGLVRGKKAYELNNHLGNNLVTISDKKIPYSVDGTTIDHYEADVITATDYYPFGMAIPNRTFSNGTQYRYGFNGKEKDKDITEGDYDYGARIYDGRICRWLSMDAFANKYPDVSPYVFALNSPIMAKDPDGNVVIFINGQHSGSGGTSAYWGGYDLRVMNRLDDHSARYVDGAMGGWKSTNGAFKDGFTSSSSPFTSIGKRVFAGILSVFKNSNVNMKLRIAMGKAQGIADAPSILANLKDGETIKLVTHSMGTAFARGYTEGILKYAKDNNITGKIKFEYELDVNAFQGKNLPADKNVMQTQTKIGGKDGGNSTWEEMKGNSVPSVERVPGAKDISTKDDADKGHAVKDMSTDGIPKVGNGGDTKSKEQGSNNGN